MFMPTIYTVGNHLTSKITEESAKKVYWEQRRTAVNESSESEKIQRQKVRHNMKKSNYMISSEAQIEGMAY